MSLIPDPETDAWMIDEGGHLLGRVWFTRLDEDGKPTEERHLIGYGRLLTEKDQR